MRSRVLTLLVVPFLFSACFSASQVRRSSNLMAYLYPNADQPPTVNEAGVHLQLPLRVGVAFVPAAPRGGWESPSIVPPGAEKELVEIVQKTFKGKDWVKDVVMIPSSYLMPGGGFANLDQVSKTFGTDVVALVSVDQMQRSDPNRLSFLYLSVIGAYVLPLDRNDTRTLIDAAVFDVPTRTLLLRAPGQNEIKGHSTGSEVDPALAQKGRESMQLAMVDLARNLEVEVDSFKQKVVSGERSNVEIVNTSGQSIRKSGSNGLWEGAAGLALAALLVARKRS